jgi:glyoxylase-like metal-dependent hydrolase (beta-lactamase superfamily II)
LIRIILGTRKEQFLKTNMAPIKIHPLLLRMSCAYLLEGDAGLFLVDTGPPGSHKAILNAIRRTGKELKLIFISHAHFDHYGSAAAIRTETGAKIAVHRADARAMALGRTLIRSGRGRGRWTMPFVPLLRIMERRLATPPNVEFQDGDRLDPYGLPACVLHTPGHTPGSSCLIVEQIAPRVGDPAGLVAFVGDLVVSGRQPHLQNLYADDWMQMADSLARVQALHPHTVYSGHGIHPIDGDVFLRLR